MKSKNNFLLIFLSLTVKRPNLRLIGIEEGEEYQLKGIKTKS